jgi:hypothetical protein
LTTLDPSGPRRTDRRPILPALLSIAACLSCDGKPPEAPSTKPVAARPGVAEVVPIPKDKVVAGQTIYVPLYSHVLTADNAQPLNLAATVFVRNVDPGRPIVLARAQYFDSGGKPVRSFLARPLKIEPLASVDFFVKESDVSGGASPSVIVEWVSEEKARDPVVESVMIGTSGTQGISFTCPGRVLVDQ